MKGVRGGGREGTQGRRQASWYDEECSNQQKVFSEYERRYYEEQTDENRVLMCTQRNVYRKLCRRKRSDYERIESERLLGLSKSDPKMFWKKINPKKHDSEKPDIGFFDHFKGLAERETLLDINGMEEIENNMREGGEVYHETLDAQMTMSELECGIKELKSGKAAGQDMVLNEFLLNAPYGVKVFILMIFNNMLKLEYFPDVWAKGVITPIFKSGDRKVTGDYRGITILSNLGKLFTKIINTRLTKWADDNSVLLESQYGFRKGKGTRDCMFILNGLIEFMFSKGLKLYCCFIDYQKCFDYIHRASLWSKLIKEGVSSKTIRLLQNMYGKMKLFVKDEENKGFFLSSCGVLQGESTSPLLFSFFVNDLDNFISCESIGTAVCDVLIQILKFADDMVIFSKTREGLQEGLDKLGEYCNKWGIIVNTLKTKIVVFRKGGILSKNDNWNFQGNHIEVVSFFKYLGIYFSSSGSFNKGTSELISSARRALFGLKRFFANNSEILPSMQLKLFNTMVSPILFYGCEVWGLFAVDPMERFYRSFLKSVLKVKSSTPDCFVYGELGVYPLYIERYSRVISYWASIISERDRVNSFVYKVYNQLYLLSLDEPDIKTWVTCVRDVLNKCGMGNYWLSQRVTNKDYFLSCFNSRIRDMYLQEWREKVNETSQGRIFQYIKINFKFECYLDILDRKLRVPLTKIRLSSHAFYIERGRWEKKKREERNCSACGVLEDKYHCLIKCPNYVNERMNLLPDNLSSRPCIYEFFKMFRSEDETSLRKLGKLCTRVIAEHRRSLYTD